MHELTERLVDRLIDYKALVRRCSRDELSATIAAALADRGAAAWWCRPDWTGPGWRWSRRPSPDRRHGAGDQLSVPELDAVDGVITSCAVAVAETGTLILDGVAGPGPPDDHA